MVRSRTYTPSPHCSSTSWRSLSMQLLHTPLDACSSQSTGHASTKQGRVCTSGSNPAASRSACVKSRPHWRPPLAGCCVVLRVRVLTPPVPHVLLHCDQSPQELISQSTGHSTSLQKPVSVSGGHAAPP